MTGNSNSGRKPQPTALRVLHGNPARRPLPTDEPEGVGVLWAPPQWMDDEQREQWNYTLDNAPPGLLSATDREIVALWVVACVEHARAVVKLREHGQVVKTREGNVIQNPYLGIVNRQALIMMRAVSELGFSPAARAGLGSRGPEFNTNGQRPTSGSRLTAYLDRKPDKLDA